MILAIVQARMGSNRLPGKVMKEVLGKPLIGYLFERLQLSKRIDKIIMASVKDPYNDALCRYVKSLGVDVFRGSEDDVLERCHLAAKPYHPKYVVRITGDCMLIDPQICDQLFEAFLREDVDYATLSPSYAEGADCEIFTFEALEEATQKAVMKSEREHVTLYFSNHPDRFKKYLLPNTCDDSKYRFTVDEPEDYLVVKSVIEELYQGKSKAFTYAEIKEFFDTHSFTRQLNAHVIRNEGLSISLKNDCVVKDMGKDSNEK